MKNTKLSLTLLLGVFTVMLLNSCSSSRSFDGYYPEQRIEGKGFGYNNVEQPAPTDNASTITTDEVVAVEENNNINTTTAVEEEVVAETPVVSIPNLPDVDMSQLSPREIKWINKLGFNQANTTAEAQPKKLNFLERAMMKMFSKIAQRQMNKHFDGAGVQGMDIADIFAIISLSAGGAAFLWYAGFLFGPAAIVFGVLALKRGTSRRGMAIAGICLGAFAVLLWILFIALIATTVAII